MSLYKHYIELTPLAAKLKKSVDRKPDKIADVYRRSISIAVNKIHHLAQKKSIGGFAISIIESVIENSEGDEVSVQSKIRIFTKKSSSLDHLRFVILDASILMDFYAVSDAMVVPDQDQIYSAYVRVRMPTIKKQPESAAIKKQAVEKSPDCNFIYLMPSSSAASSKKLIRFYYKVVSMPCLKPAQFSKPDGYGFSRTNRLCVVANF